MILDPHPEVCWRRKRERELTFIEAKIRSGNRVEKTENGNDPGTVTADNKSLGSLECRYVQQLKTQAGLGSWRGSLTKTFVHIRITRKLLIHAETV